MLFGNAYMVSVGVFVLTNCTYALCVKLLSHLQKDIEELQDLIKAGDRELFEDILANTVSRKIRGKIKCKDLDKLVLIKAIS